MKIALLILTNLDSCQTGDGKRICQVFFLTEHKNNEYIDVADSFRTLLVIIDFNWKLCDCKPYHILFWVKARYVKIVVF